MRAALYHGVGDVRIEDVEEPTPGPGQVKIRVAYNGLCGTDLHEVFDEQRAVPSEPHPLTGVRAPIILGHEIAGVVVDPGPGGSDLEEGTLVAVEPLVTCGSCRWCRAGQLNLCDRLAFHGLSTGGGGLAEYTVVSRSMLHVAPPDLGARRAAMVEPLAVAWHAVDRSQASAGQAAAVVGGGPVGIGIYLVLRARGLEAVVVEPSADRRRLVAALGASTVDPGDGPVSAALRDLTGGRGVDICFETSATVAGIETALGATAKHGTVMLLASPRQPLPPVLGVALAGELVIRTSYAYHDVFPAVLDALASDRLPIAGWVETAPLSDLHESLAAMRAGRLAKVLIDPAG